MRRHVFKYLIKLNLNCAISSQGTMETRVSTDLSRTSTRPRQCFIETRTSLWVGTRVCPLSVPWTDGKGERWMVPYRPIYCPCQDALFKAASRQHNRGTFRKQTSSDCTTAGQCIGQAQHSGLFAAAPSQMITTITSQQIRSHARQLEASTTVSTAGGSSRMKVCPLLKGGEADWRSPAGRSHRVPLRAHRPM